MLDLDVLLQPATSEPPGGPDLTYAADYAALERAAAGKPERQVGAAIVPGEPPDWRTATASAKALLGQSKDLRIAIVLTRALLETGGFEGLAAGLGLIRGLIEKFWPTLHPRLDAEDEDDPTVRVNAMAALTHRDVLLAIRSAPLITSKSFGPVTLRSLEASAAPPPAPAKGAPATAAASPAATLEAAFQQVSAEGLAQAEATLARCVQEAAGLVKSWAENLPSAGPDFTELRKTLGQAHAAVRTRMQQRQPAGPAPSASAGAGAGPAAAAADGSLTPTIQSAIQSIQGEVHSREDVLRALDAICAYYARAEPSSPVPLLLQRSRRLVTMSFMDIVKEILPESAANLQKITGKTDG